MSDTISPNPTGVAAADLRFDYPSRCLWQNLSFSAPGGSVLLIRGESGSGKTTLLQCIGSLARPTAGSLSVGGVEPGAQHGRRLRAFRREVVGFAFQNAGIIPWWSVRKNIEVVGTRVTAEDERVRAAFELFRLPITALTRPVHSLSGGEQQRVGLVRLMIQAPHVLLLDEPTSALDDVNTERVITFLRHHSANGGVAVIATHDARLAPLADDVLSLATPERGT